jgi:hypothetical protein
MVLLKRNSPRFLGIIFWIPFLSFFFLQSSFAFTPKRIGVFYFKETFGIIHEKEDTNSSSLKIVSCGYPLEVYEAYNSGPDNKWAMVKKKSLEGFVLKKLLSKKWPRCFIRKYSKFFGEFQMSETDLYFWAKYKERVEIGKSRAR